MYHGTRADEMCINIINLTKHVEALNSENYKMLLKEIKEDPSQWENMPWI